MRESRQGQRPVSGVTLMLEQSKEAKVSGLEVTSDYVHTFRIPSQGHWHLLLRWETKKKKKRWETKAEE